MTKYLKDTFSGRNVLVTGHTGFKGSWLSIWLRELGANVIGLSLEPITASDNYVLSDLKNKIIDIKGDIRDKQLVNKVFCEHKPEIVFHLAAQPLVRFSYDNPQYTFEVNVIGTSNILDAIKETEETKAGIIVTSDKCYKNNEWVWGYRENDSLGGIDPYSCSKACSELVVSSYRASYFNEKRYNEHKKVLATARAGNVIGGGDWSADRIIPDCIRAFEVNEKISLRNPDATRPWQHVLEPISGYLLLAARILEDNIKYSGAWNFGPEASSIISVKQIVEKVIDAWGSGGWLNISNSEQPHEANLLSLDINKAKSLLKWQPHWDIDKAVEKTIEWYKSYKNKDIYDLCVKQIEEYNK